MRILYTKHASRKFSEERYVKQLKITKSVVKNIIKNPDIIDDTRGEKITAIGKIDLNHSLIVVYKIVENAARIITFYPAERGRYESKILQRG
ncbi:DUF4258 domain-containing protein [Candidatus Gottesmanbacteria bacterium]|nr:DUF4258 domain-containing protein [Candidatus Gottesmanbacteria bacterium]